MRGLVAVVVLVGCHYTSPGGAPKDGAIDAASDAPGTEAGVDADIDAPQILDAPLPAAQCFGTFETICLPDPLPTNDLNINSVTIDTSNPANCDLIAEGTTVDACVRAGTSVNVNGTVTATGSRPLVLLATAGNVQINGTGHVDVSSHRIANILTRGAGANPAGCTGTAPQQSGGGFGGTFGGAGGNGNNGAGGGIGGVADGVGNIDTLTGGCPGANGGNTTGTRGNGGGGVFLLATNQITVDGIIEASGAGALGGPGDLTTAKGGGGGGSGGLIVFEAPAVTLQGCKLQAQGGGGGQGNKAAAAGGTGNDPTLLAVGTAATGGSGLGGGTGGNGGTSSAGGAGGSGGATGGGGGGGGGSGKILRKTDNSQSSGCQVSPSVTSL